MLIFYSQKSWAGFEAFDRLRAGVNKAWYEAAVGKCSNLPIDSTESEKVKVKNYLQSRGYCASGARLPIGRIEDLNEELKEKIFYDAVVEDMAIKNQCELESVAYLSTAGLDQKNELATANSELRKFYPQLQSRLSSAKHKVPTGRSLKDATEAQDRIVKTFVETAGEVAKLESQLAKLRSVRPFDPGYAEVQLLSQKMEILKNSLPMGEKKSVQDFFSSIYAKIRLDSFQGKKIDYDQVVKEFTGVGPNSFQKKVVESDYDQLLKKQKSLAAMKGRYGNQHAFKVKAFEEGHAEALLYGMNSQAEQGLPFYRMHCELQAKYGIGSEISSIGNNMALAVVTAGQSAGSLLLSRLVQVGAMTKRSAAVINIVNSSVSGTAAAGELGYSLMTACFDNPGGAPKFSACEQKQNLEIKGISAYVKEDVENSNCMISLATAALSGASAVRSAMKAQALNFENRLQSAGLLDSYKKARQKIESSVLPENYKSQIDKELKTAMKSVKSDGAPNPQLMEALAQEDPDSLYSMLKQINETNKDSWADKVRSWIRGKQMSPEEGLELEACLIQNGKSTTAKACSFPTAS